MEKLTFKTGRTYDTAQELECYLIDGIVYMIDESRNCSYKMKCGFSEREILSTYDYGLKEYISDYAIRELAKEAEFKPYKEVIKTYTTNTTSGYLIRLFILGSHQPKYDFTCDDKYEAEEKAKEIRMNPEHIKSVEALNRFNVMRKE